MQNEQSTQNTHVEMLSQFSSTVKIIGEYTPIKKYSSQKYMQTLIFDPSAKSFIPSNIANSIMKTCNMSTKIKINPIKVVAQGQTIGIIDQNNNAWILSQIFQYPVNLSFLLKKRVIQMFLNQKQAILKTKKGLILINWGAKKLLDNQSLSKIPIYDSKSYYQNFFEAFSILDGTLNDFFLISNIKKSQNSNKMYRVTNEGREIHGYPTLEKFYGFHGKIVGISVGKYHTLCWDEYGGIYSWGSRTLALGFQNLPDEDLITQPTRLNFNFLVKTAFAANQYSLALSTDGRLYQWGIKKEINQINEQLIFQPRVLTFKYFKCSNQKFTILKGKYEKFGLISTTGQMYVWGQKARSLIHPQASVPRQWQNGRLYEPYLVHIPSEQKIIDFAIQQNYLSLILIPKTCRYQLKEQTQYWNNVIQNVKSKFQLRKYKKIQTEFSRNSTQKITRIATENTPTHHDKVKESLRKSLTIKQPLSNRLMVKSQNSCRAFMKTSRDDKVKKAESIKKSKQKFLQIAKSDEELFTYVMQPVKKQNILEMLVDEFPQREQKRSNTKMTLTLSLNRNHSQKRFYNQTQGNFSNFFETSKLKSSLPDYFKQFDLQRVEQIKKRRRQQQKKLLIRNSSDFLSKTRTEKKSYTVKLQQVIEKKKQLETENFNQTLRKLEENSLQHRIKRHQQLQIQKEREQTREMVKNTIYKYLIKNYLVKLFTSPLAKGREIKIENFARNLKFQRIQRNIRKVFIKAKVKFALKKLQSSNLSRFILLAVQWRKYVKRFRQRKYKQKRKMIVQELMKNFIKDKIELGLSMSNMNIRKIHKFREWITLVKNERMKCLKYLWRIRLLSIMKINPDVQNTVIYHLPKNIEELTFQSLYEQKIKENPNLKLATFLNKSPVFKIKINYFRTVANLFTQQKKPLHRSEKIINFLSQKNRRPKIKFFDSDEDDKQKQPTHKINLMSGDILPYSVHYSFFTRPKLYDLALSQTVRKSQKWIKQQRQILQRTLRNIIQKHQKELYRKNEQYDIQLAHFIKQKYDMLSQKRWRYIIEYNQTVKTMSKKKKEKELYRLMDLIGMKNVLDQDCIPEKQIILEEALKRKDAPKQPYQYIVFGLRQFKEAFRLYYDHVQSKAKMIKKAV